MCSIFIGGLLPETTLDDLRKYFTQFGEIVHINMPQKKKRNECKGFAFLELSLYSLTQEEMLSREHFIGSKKVDIQPTMKFQEKLEKLTKLQENKIFIGKFSRTVNLSILVKKLSEYCNVINCNFVNPKSRKRALIQVELSDPRVCDRLSRTGFLFQGCLYKVSRYRPKMAWQLYEKRCAVLKFEEDENSVNDPLGMHKPETKSFNFNSSQSRSQNQDHSLTNYRFNIVVKYIRLYSICNTQIYEYPTPASREEELSTTRQNLLKQNLQDSIRQVQNIAYQETKNQPASLNQRK